MPVFDPHGRLLFIQVAEQAFAQNMPHARMGLLLALVGQIVTTTASVVFARTIEDADASSARNAVSDQRTNEPAPLPSEVAGRAYDFDFVIEIGFHAIKTCMSVMKAEVRIVAVNATNDPDTAFVSRPAMRPCHRSATVAAIEIAMFFEKADAHPARGFTCILGHTLEINRTW